MELLNNVFFWSTLILGIAFLSTYGYANYRKSMQKRKALERARFVKDVRTAVRDYLKELQK